MPWSRWKCLCKSHPSSKEAHVLGIFLTTASEYLKFGTFNRTWVNWRNNVHMLCSTSFSLSPQCWPRTWTIPPKNHFKTTLEERKTCIRAVWPKLRVRDCSLLRRGGALCDVTKTAAMAHVRRFPGLLRQFISVTYPRRLGGKRLDKNRIRMRTLLFENSGLSFTALLGPRDPKRRRPSRGGLVAFAQSPFLPFFFSLWSIDFYYPFSAIAEVYKNEGNNEFNKGEFGNARYFYTEGIRVKCKDDELTAKLYSNRAIANFRLGELSCF